MAYTYDYPHPAVTVDIVIFTIVDDDFKVLLIQRDIEPFEGMWALPGGFVGLDESLRRAAWRELKEETGVDGANPTVFNAIDLIEAAPAESGLPAEPTHHDLMIAVHLDWRAGSPAAGDDALEARWVAAAALPRPLCADVEGVVAQALARAGKTS